MLVVQKKWTLRWFLDINISKKVKNSKKLNEKKKNSNHLAQTSEHLMLEKKSLRHWKLLKMEWEKGYRNEKRAERDSEGRGLDICIYRLKWGWGGYEHPGIPRGGYGCHGNSHRANPLVTTPLRPHHHPLLLHFSLALSLHNCILKKLLSSIVC